MNSKYHFLEQTEEDIRKYAYEFNFCKTLVPVEKPAHSPYCRYQCDNDCSQNPSKEEPMG